LLIRDEFHGRGLGSALARKLVEIGGDEGVHRITADMLPQNLGMNRICTKLGFSMVHDQSSSLVRATLDLTGARAE
jgi:acetyltransferase